MTYPGMFEDKREDNLNYRFKDRRLLLSKHRNLFSGDIKHIAFYININ